VHVLENSTAPIVVGFVYMDLLHVCHLKPNIKLSICLLHGFPQKPTPIAQDARASKGPTCFAEVDLVSEDVACFLHIFFG